MSEAESLEQSQRAVGAAADPGVGEQLEPQPPGFAASGGEASQGSGRLRSPVPLTPR